MVRSRGYDRAIWNGGVTTMDFAERLALAAVARLAGDADYVRFRDRQVRAASDRAALRRAEMEPAPDDAPDVLQRLALLAWRDEAARKDPERTVGEWLWEAYRPDLTARWEALGVEERRERIGRARSRILSGEAAHVRRAQLLAEGVRADLAEAAVRIIAPRAEARLRYGAC